MVFFVVNCVEIELLQSKWLFMYEKREEHENIWPKVLVSITLPYSVFHILEIVVWCAQYIDDALPKSSWYTSISVQLSWYITMTIQCI